MIIRFRRWEGHALIGVRPGYGGCLKKNKVFFLRYSLVVNWGTRWRSWLSHCATSHKVAGLIPDGVNEIFQ
jgi:hypothetical protein